MADDFSLNDKSNLNPSVGNNYFPEDVKKLTREEKKVGIENWNNKPINKNNGIKAVDTSSLWLKNIAMFTLIIIAIAAIIFAYIAWKDGTLLPNLNCISSPVDCGNTTVEPTQCNCGNLTCPNITMPNITIIPNITIQYNMS